MSATAIASSTRDRLLQAATEVFMEVGFRQATFRAICSRAGANNAAINYYFRDKEHLYLEVMQQAIDEVEEVFSSAHGEQTLAPEEQLRTFVRSMLTKLLSPGGPNRLVKLISHEMIEPTIGLDVVIEKLVKPLDAGLCAIIRQLVGAHVSDQQVHDCSRSIMAQCHVFDHARLLIARMGLYPVYDAETIEHLVDHVTRFSLGGIRAMAGR